MFGIWMTVFSVYKIDPWFTDIMSMVAIKVKDGMVQFLMQELAVVRNKLEIKTKVEGDRLSYQFCFYTVH